QQHHSMGQEDGARLPQRGELQDRHLFSLWRPESLPTPKLVEPKKLLLTGDNLDEEIFQF
ncbi:MAG: hypothetical protein AB7P17_14265, partial [Nitrospirales bacterium]